MRLQRGFTLLELGLALGIALAIAAAIHATAGAVKDWKDEIRAAERKAVLLEVATRDNIKLIAANKRIQELEAAQQAQEAEHAARLAAVAKDLMKEKANVQAEKDRIAADIAAGRLVRNVAAFRWDGLAGSGGGRLGPAGTGAGGGNEAAACELSAEAQGRVLDIGAEADEVAKQLAAAQAVIEEDRRLCGPKLQPTTN